MSDSIVNERCVIVNEGSCHISHTRHTRFLSVIHVWVCDIRHIAHEWYSWMVPSPFGFLVPSPFGHSLLSVIHERSNLLLSVMNERQKTSSFMSGSCHIWHDDERVMSHMNAHEWRSRRSWMVFMNGPKSLWICIADLYVILRPLAQSWFNSDLWMVFMSDLWMVFMRYKFKFAEKRWLEPSFSPFGNERQKASIMSGSCHIWHDDERVMSHMNAHEWCSWMVFMSVLHECHSRSFICDMTHSTRPVWHDSFNCDWLIHSNRATHVNMSKCKCCSVLQCVAVCCSVLQCDAVCCSALQCVAVCCSVLQCVAVCCSVVQCVAVCCNRLQCVAVCCSGILQQNHSCQQVKMISRWHASFNCTSTVTHWHVYCHIQSVNSYEYRVVTHWHIYCVRDSLTCPLTC